MAGFISFSQTNEVRRQTHNGTFVRTLEYDMEPVMAPYV